jgi:hypothetical protein
MHAKACKLAGMTNKLHLALTEFAREAGLSAHRVGILAAGNGRLIERLEGAGRVWPETEAKAWGFLRSDRAAEILRRKSRRSPDPRQSSVGGGV